jgi:hypothetical protein
VSPTQRRVSEIALKDDCRQIKRRRCVRFSPTIKRCCRGCWTTTIASATQINAPDGEID